MSSGKESSKAPFVEGECSCGHVRFSLNNKPLIVHCCHCTYCQRETGSAFVINAVIEESEVECEDAKPELVETPSHSGRGQKIARCPKCQVAVWSIYSDPGLYYVRVGTLKKTQLCPPDIHIYTASKQNWVDIPDGAKAVEEFYKPKDVWSTSSLERMTVLALRMQKLDGE